MKTGKNRKKKTALIVISVTVIVLAGIAAAGYFAVNKAFSMLTNSMYQSSSIQEETELSENKSAEQLPGTEGETERPQTSGAGESNTQNGASGSQKDALSAAQEKFGIDGAMRFSAEQLKKLEKSVSLGDKLAVMAIISRSLSTSDYQTLLSMTGGGITREEISQAYSILSRSLSGEDKSKIYEYYSKYAYLLKE